MRTSITSLVVLSALLLALPSAGRTAPVLPVGSPSPGETPRKAPEEDPEESPQKDSEKSPKNADKAVEKENGKKEERQTPPRVQLPPPGTYMAVDILSLAGLITGRTVRMESARVRETRVHISSDVGDTDVTLDELTIILAVHQLYLFPVEDPEEGKLLVVSKSPFWKDEPERYTKIIEVPGSRFQAVAREVRKLVETRNAQLPKDARPMVAVPAARVGKIFVASERKPDLEAVARLLEKLDVEKKKEDRPHLYTYAGQFQLADDLLEKVLADLQEGERNRLRIIVASRGNRLLYRCTPTLAEKVQTLLKKYDKRKGSIQPPRR